MTLAMRVIRATLDSLAHDFREKGERAVHAKILSMYFHWIEGVRSLFMMATVALVGTILFSLSLFQWLRNIYESSSGTRVYMDMADIFGDLFLWLGLISLAVVVLTLRQRNWLRVFRVNEKLQPFLAEFEPATHGGPAAGSSRNLQSVSHPWAPEGTYEMTVDEIADRQRREFARQEGFYGP